MSVELVDVREFALALPRSYERLVRDRVKFNVGRIVYLALSRDETVLGFACWKHDRPGLLAAEPEKFLPPSRGDERYNWLLVRLAALDRDELRELVEDAWRLAVPQRLAAETLGPR